MTVKKYKRYFYSLPMVGERTEQEFKALFEKAGLQLTNITMTPSTLSIVEAILA